MMHNDVSNNNSLLFGDWRGGLFLAWLLIDQCGGQGAAVAAAGAE